MIAKSVAEFTGQTFWQVLESNILEVLTVGTLLKEQVIVEENKHGRISS